MSYLVGACWTCALPETLCEETYVVKAEKKCKLPKHLMPLLCYLAWSDTRIRTAGELYLGENWSTLGWTGEAFKDWLVQSVAFKEDSVEEGLVAAWNGWLVVGAMMRAGEVRLRASGTGRSIGRAGPCGGGERQVERTDAESEVRGRVGGQGEERDQIGLAMGGNKMVEG